MNPNRSCPSCRVTYIIYVIKSYMHFVLQSGAIIAMIGYVVYNYPDARFSIAFVDMIIPHSFSAQQVGTHNSSQQGILMFKVVFSLYLNINQSACITRNRVMNFQSHLDWLSYQHHWEFSIHKKIISMLTSCHIAFQINVELIKVQQRMKIITAKSFILYIV